MVHRSQLRGSRIGRFQASVVHHAIEDRNLFSRINLHRRISNVEEGTFCGHDPDTRPSVNREP